MNFSAVKAGRSALRHIVCDSVSTEPYVAARFSDEQNKSLAIPGLTRFESLAAHSAEMAIRDAGIDVTAENVVFILSTTKANIECLVDGDEPIRLFSPSNAAEHIAKYLGITTPPIVVCNACISGVAAIITANRLIDNGSYDYAVVCGADVLSRFVFSGFQALKALSSDECRPFDIERNGLNLGEAGATVVFSAAHSKYKVESGAIRNDAYHISSPSKNGEGAYLALRAIDLEQRDNIGFINAHGTATLFNDQMEAVAINRASYGDIPVNGLKGFFGHTMGAAGILETIISKEALEQGMVLATRGFDETGTSVSLNLAPYNRETAGSSFIKMISGFGGGNAAILVRKEDDTVPQETKLCDLDGQYYSAHRVVINSQSATCDGQQISCKEKGRTLLVELYKKLIADYPKFYKMDPLCRLGFVASELLLQSAAEAVQAVIFFNHSSSALADRAYWATVNSPTDSFPSPAHFVYTLPNIVTGEIAMRNGIRGETAFYILPERNEHTFDEMMKSVFSEGNITSALAGWIDYPDDENFVADLRIIRRQA